MFVKICGITNEEDALTAVALGADAVGFVFAPSSRQVNASTARDIISRLPPDILTVGVFRDQSPRQVIDIIQTAKIRGVQLHGHETPEDADQIRPYCQVLIAAFAAGDPKLAHVDDYGADAVLVDSPSPGSGKVFDWSLADGAPSGRRIILAGGLNPANVAAGIEEVRPWGVDVSTGVEVDGVPGQKDALKMQAFIHAARAAGERFEEPEDLGNGGFVFDWADSDI